MKSPMVKLKSQIKIILLGFCLGNINGLSYAIPAEISDLGEYAALEQSEAVPAQIEASVINRLFTQIQEELNDLRGQVEVQQQIIQQLKLQISAREKSSESGSVKRSTFSFLNTKKSDVATTTELDPDHQKKLFQQAYRLVMDQGNQEAILALQDYLTRYPEGEHALDSYYWLGEVCLSLWQQDRAQGDYLSRSIDAFSVLKNHPDNPKTSQALLKLGLIESEQGHINAAKKYFESVRESYPNTVSAKVAHARLLRLSQLSEESN